MYTLCLQMENGESGAGEPAPPREIQILETAEDIQLRREEVLGRYQQFKVRTLEYSPHLSSTHFPNFKKTKNLFLYILLFIDPVVCLVCEISICLQIITNCTNYTGISCHKHIRLSP